MLVLIIGSAPLAARDAIVFISDAGDTAGIPTMMHGVVYSVSKEIDIFDLTHRIPPFNIGATAFRLYETAPPIGPPVRSLSLRSIPESRKRDRLSR